MVAVRNPHHQPGAPRLARVAIIFTGCVLLTSFQALQPSVTVEQTVRPGETQVFTASAAAGDFLHLEITHGGTGIVASLLSPHGETVAAVFSFPAQTERIPLSAISTGGDYRVQVTTHPRSTVPAQYRITLAALHPAQPIDRRQIAAEALMAQGLKLRGDKSSDRLQAALEKYQQAAAVWREIHNLRQEAASLLAQGEVNFYLGDYKQALHFSLQALPLARAAKDRASEATALNNSAALYLSLGDLAQSAGMFEQAIQLHHTNGNPLGEASARNNLGMLRIRLGDTQAALEQFERARGILSTVPGSHQSLSTLINIASVYLRWGEFEKALDQYREALTAAAAAGDKGQHASVMTLIAQVHESMGQPRKAIEVCEPALALARASGDRRQVGYTLERLGDIRRALGDYTGARALLDEAVKLWRDVGDSEGELVTLVDLARLLIEMKQPREAREFALQAVAIAKRTGDRRWESNALYRAGAAEFALGNLPQAQSTMRNAIEIDEDVRGKTVNFDLRTSFFATAAREYNTLIAILAARHTEDPHAGFAAQAFEASESVKARGLLDHLIESGAAIEVGVSPALLSKEKQLRASLSDRAQRQIQLMAGKHTADQLAARAQEIRSLTSAYEQVEAQIRTESPRYAALTQPRPLSLERIQKEVLDSETVLLEYALGDTKSFLWAVTSGTLELHELPAKPTVEEAARRAYEAISVPGGNTSPALAALSRMLLSPVAPLLGRKRILVVADGALQYIPMAVLPVPGTTTPLVATHEVVSLPSASTLAILRQEIAGRKPARRSVAILADPVFESDDPRVTAEPPPVALNFESAPKSANESLRFDRLRSTRVEAQAIAAMADPKLTLIALGFDATRDRVLSGALADYRIVHLATHGILNTEHPRLSSLVFSMVGRTGRPIPGILPVSEVYKLKLGADLVVLSACRTALGKDIRGEGFVGITRGFMYAGAPRVVASLWQVPDLATAELMRRFYAGILRRHLPPAAALHEAQASMWREPRWSSPYYWAAFSLQGEWK